MYRTFLPREIFHGKNEGTSKTLIMCDGNLLLQLMVQKLHSSVTRNMPHMTPNGAVLNPPSPLKSRYHYSLNILKTRSHFKGIF